MRRLLIAGMIGYVCGVGLALTAVACDAGGLLVIEWKDAGDAGDAGTDSAGGGE